MKNQIQACHLALRGLLDLFLHLFFLCNTHGCHSTQHIVAIFVTASSTQKHFLSQHLAHSSHFCHGAQHIVGILSLCLAHSRHFCYSTQHIVGILPWHLARSRHFVTALSTQQAFCHSAQHVEGTEQRPELGKKFGSLKSL